MNRLKPKKLASSFTVSMFLVLIAVFGFMTIGQTENVYADDYTATVNFVTLDKNGNEVDPPTTGGQPKQYWTSQLIENGAILNVSGGQRIQLINPNVNSSDGYYLDKENTTITGEVEKSEVSNGCIELSNISGDLVINIVYREKKIIDPIDITLPTIKCGTQIKVTEDGDKVTQTPTPGITATSGCGYDVETGGWISTTQGWFKSGDEKWGYNSDDLFSGKITKDTDVWARVLITPADGYDFNWNSDEYEYYGSVSVNGKASSESKAYVGSWCLMVFAKLDTKDLVHDWDNGKVTKEATTTATGVKTFTCKGCGATKTQTIPKKEKKPAKKETKPAKKATTAKPFLLAQMTTNGSKALNISWFKVKGADGYEIYFTKCNRHHKKNTPKKIKTIKGDSTTKWVKKGLKKKVAYKAYVKAYKMKNGKKTYIATSPAIHAITANSYRGYTNAKSVSVKKASVSLKVGGTSQIKANIKKVKSGKKLIHKSHMSAMRYYSNNKKIATVNSSGKIKAVAKGSCKVYAVAPNGVKKAVKVTVK